MTLPATRIPSKPEKNPRTHESLPPPPPISLSKASSHPKCLHKRGLPKQSPSHPSISTENRLAHRVPPRHFEPCKNPGNKSVILPQTLSCLLLAPIPKATKPYPTPPQKPSPAKAKKQKDQATSSLTQMRNSRVCKIGSSIKPREYYKLVW